jgi:hypothetical protein
MRTVLIQNHWQAIFSIGSLTVLPFWLLLILLPKADLTRRVMKSAAVILGPTLLYAFAVLPHLSEILPPLLKPQLAKIALLLGSPSGATAAWLHFLAFDLFLGRWIYLDSRERDISPLLVSPILVLTLLLGPVGFLAYIAIARFWRPGSTTPAVVASAADSGS